MKKLFIVAVVACATLLSGCSAHFYSSSNASVSVTVAYGNSPSLQTACKLRAGSVRATDLISHAVSYMSKGGHIYAANTNEMYMLTLF